MKVARLKFKQWYNGIISRFSQKIAEYFESPKKTFLFLAIFVFTILFFVEMGIILINNSFYNNFSDDILQYYTIMVDFVAQIKAGTLSSFNLNNYLGASYFSDVYYIPLDIFTAITFILSYIVPTELAYSITELIKIWAGVMVFAYYLSLCGMKNRTIFWMGVIYFISGGSVSFMAFPVFLSLTFYLPLGLVVIHWFLKGKKWIVPLYVLALILYDFYLGYTAIAFVSILFIIEAVKQPNFRFFRFILDGIMFLGLILLGVLMSTVILYPSILYILEETYRPENTFDAWTVTIGSFDLKLFKPTIYIRIFAKLFVEQKPIGFYGFENHYGQEHISLFISVVGLVYMNYVYFMRDKISRVYKVAILLSFIMMFLPIFSYVFSGTTDVPYTRWINMLPIVQVMILAHVFDQFGFEKIKMKWMSIPIVVMLAMLGYLIYYYILKLKTDTHYVSRDVMTADTVLMGVAALILILILIFGWLKRFRWIKRIFWVEFIVAVVYIYSGPFAITNKIDTFQEMDAISEFLEANLTQDEFYRVYVDFERLDVEKINFNRMTNFATNTQIFHSWTDAETNMITYLLFGVNEYQSKDRLDIQSIYLNHFLGYRYLLVSAEGDYHLPELYYTQIATSDEFILYEIDGSEAFQVYESYIKYEHFDNMSEYTRQKILLISALIDADRYDADSMNLTQQGSVSSNYYTSVSPFSSLNHNSATVVNATGITNTASRPFLMYDVDQLNIGFEVGAAYIRTTFGVNALLGSDYGEVYMTFADGTSRSCEIMTDSALKHRVKCEFWQEPTAIFFEQNDQYTVSGKTEIRLERAIGQSAYLVYDFENMQEFGMMAFKLGSLDLERTFLVDAMGNETECFDKFCFMETRPTRIYLLKTGKMYETENLFALDFQYLYDDLSFYDENAVTKISEDQSLTISGGKIHLSYTRTSTTSNDQIVMIPVAYSEDWEITSGIFYETISVSGGFLGIVIPFSVNEIDITMKFVPKGLKTGALASLAGVLIYLGIFVPILVIENKKRKSTNRLPVTEVSIHEDIDNHSTGL